MTETEIAALQADLAKQKEEAEKLKKDLEDTKKLVPPQPNLPGIPPLPPTPNPTLEEQAKKNADDKKKIEIEQKKVEETIKFNISIEQFINDNVAIVGEEVKNIVALSKNMKYANSLEEANDKRANILGSFFKQQANIDALITDKFKARATEFLELATVERNKRSGDYWDLFELAVENLKLKIKQEELTKITSGKNTDVKVEAHNEKFFAARSHFILAKLNV